jgi:cystathionine beta-lyase/cystathionine gamma-synthase
MSKLKNEDSDDLEGLGFATRAIHIGQKSDSETGAINVPIYQTSTYEQVELGKDKGFIYGRTHNPTRSALERSIASLENGDYGLAFASGLAACATVTQLLRPGDHILVSNAVYGGVYRLFEQMVSRYQINITYIDTDDLVAIEQAIFSNTKMLWLETPTNPLLKLADLAALCNLAQTNHIVTVVDNTFASPYFQRPLEFGADIVVHSTTKYLNGHSDVIGGAIVTSRADLYEELHFLQNALGAVPGPLDCFLTLRGIKTLAIRMRQHAQSAQKLAEFLSTHPGVSSVIYPGLPSNPQYELAKRQMSGFSGIIACELGGLDAVRQLLKETKVFTLAESLGGARSLICHPSTMTHASIPKSVQIECGITEGLVRVSVGLEDVDDLIADLDRAIPQRKIIMTC